jgi:hypothetical protein
MSPAEMIRRLGRLDIQTATEESVLETAEEYVQLNTQQMYEGKDSYGRQISPGYASEGYADEKHQMNPVPGYGVPDLKYSGDFYRNWGISVQGGKIIGDSDVEYADKLFEKYDDIAGLDPENMNEYRQGPFREALKEKVEEQFYG